MKPQAGDYYDTDFASTTPLTNRTSIYVIAQFISSHNPA
jgi:hypothetical protein